MHNVEDLGFENRQLTPTQPFVMSGNIADSVNWKEAELGIGIIFKHEDSLFVVVKSFFFLTIFLCRKSWGLKNIIDLGWPLSIITLTSYLISFSQREIMYDYV